MGAKKVAKVWTVAERKRKSEGMKAYWRKRNGAKASQPVPQEHLMSWKLAEPLKVESLGSRLIKVELASAALREALAAL